MHPPLFDCFSDSNRTSRRLVAVGFVFVHRVKQNPALNMTGSQLRLQSSSRTQLKDKAGASRILQKREAMCENVSPTRRRPPQNKQRMQQEDANGKRGIESLG